MYLDEVGFHSPLIREYAYAKWWQRIVRERKGKRFARTSMTAGLKKKRCVAPMEFKGDCHTTAVLSWVKQWLIPALEPGDTVIWDNVTFQKSPKIKATFEQADMKLLFLQAYSPDHNTMECL